ncbi:glutamine-hydrolyzing carbamoyl-phosphate synthase small subunit [Zooshikella harenae]|uniref:Carbamoyl phosphate synthase small chain n=1 Tax=Zooshikella harenae TaxID=2827238 RepID=A0ABS5ZBG9_9GAMM|nr:glutamine-hydrolyzing carbamoyl-phosphate synthase small subunit [Zooshikella harenae]MBU2710595.1 glutamine-hydrolyzing carbamoyl-phosphate synthase small subunit [Zooshikella harenae]
MSTPAILALEDGSIFSGVSIGADGQTAGEVVFNTAITGYQEILTDPSYARQLVTLTYPHIGNTGINQQDNESTQVWASGLIIRELSPVVSNWRSQQSLSEFLKEKGIVAIAEIDTRRLTRILREKGALSGCIMAGTSISETEAFAQTESFPGLKGMDLASVVTTDKIYEWNEGEWQPSSNDFSASNEKPYHVVAYDFGVKHNILRMLAHRGCRITVVPATTPASEVLAIQPDGVFLSNGPGDPEPCAYAIESIRALLEANMPLFGICLGHQLLALASGAKTEKMKFGHHGANHPVQDLNTSKVMITSQNHGFAVSKASLPENVEVTHKSLFDQSLQGIRLTDKPAFSFQGHPEASPGPHDVAPLFDLFIDLIRSRR